MSEWVAYVRAFHAAGDLGDAPTPKLPASSLREMRSRILREEFIELQEAEDANDIVEIADALADIMYVAIGTCLEYGIPIDAVMAEVQRSNMSKCIEGKLTKRADGKILKPDTYSPPDIRKALGL